MDPIAIAMGLAQFAPALVRWITGSDKAEAVAEKAIDIARTVTGKDAPDAAAAAIAADPALALRFRQAVLEQATEFERLAVANASDVNQTMRAESVSERWPQYSWRPAIGFSVAFAVTLTVLTVFLAYGMAVFGKDASGLQYLPGIIAAIAGLIGVVSPILGIASWFRGRMQAEQSRLPGA